MPDWKREIRKRLEGLPIEPARENEIVEELAQHLEALEQELRADNATEAETARLLLEELTEGELLRQELRLARRFTPPEPVFVSTGRKHMMADLWQDLRYSARSLLKNPGFSVVAIVILALGIGANTAIFSIVNAVLIQPLPYPDARQLAMIFNTSGGDVRWPFNPGAYLNLRARNTSFSDLAALSNKGWPANLTESGDPERLQGFKVSANLFQVLGVNPEEGRSFLAEEDRAGAAHVVVISYNLWQRRFGGDPQIIGEPIRLNGDSYTVVGIMPADFRFMMKTDVWTTLSFTTDDEQDPAGYLEVIGRLKSNASFEQASAEVEQISREFINKPDLPDHAVLDQPQVGLNAEVRPMLLMLMAAVGFVLLIACANIANLLLARGNAKRRDIAIRAALGARRRRVVGHLLTESMLLALAGGGLGLLLANWIIQFVASGLPEYLADANSRVALLSIDRMALGFTFALALITSALFGLVPALQLSKVDLTEALKEGGRAAGRRTRLHSSLVVAEVALAMVLLVGSGLMIKSFWKLSRVNLGYQPAGVLTAKIDPSGPRYPDFDAVTAFYQELLARIRSVPGVRDAGLKNSLGASFPFSIDEHPPVSRDQRSSASLNQVSADFFRAYGIPLRSGRYLDDRDVKGTQPVVVIDEAFAHKYFPDEFPIGKHLTCKVSRFAPDISYEIVGVVGGAKYWRLDHDPYPHMYYSYLQDNWWSMELVVRVKEGDPTKLIAPIREELGSIDKDQPIHSFVPLEQSVSEMLAPQRFTTILMASFAALAAILAAIGLYGVMSYTVVQRTKEIGVRMALGARGGDVLKVIVRQGLVLIGTGIVLGLGGSFALSRLIRGLLFEIQPTDPLNLVEIAFLLVIVGSAACLIPARRALRVDPIVALRYE